MNSRHYKDFSKSKIDTKPSNENSKIGAISSINYSKIKKRLHKRSNSMEVKTSRLPVTHKNRLILESKIFG